MEAEKQRKIKTLVFLYTIGTILIGTGVICFIAANDWLVALFKNNNLLKIFSLLSATLIALFGGYHLAHKTKYKRLGNAFIFLSTLLIGSVYALLGQIYHFEANSAKLMFLWVISILPLAFLFHSYAINILSIILFLIGCILLEAPPIFYQASLLLYSIANIPYLEKNFNKFALSYKILSLLIIFFILLFNAVAPVYHQAYIGGLMSLPILAIAAINILNIYFQKNTDKLFILETGFILLLMFLFGTWFIPSLLAHILLIFVIGSTFHFGCKFKNSKLLNLNTFFLIIYLTTTYCRWGWDFFDKALFFILGGGLILSIGIFMEKKKKEIIDKDTKND